MSTLKKLLATTKQEILASRKAVLEDEIIDALNDKSEWYNRRVRDAKRRQSEMLDISPKNWFSMEVVKPDFNAQRFIDELHKSNLELDLLLIEQESFEKLKNQLVAEDGNNTAPSE